MAMATGVYEATIRDALKNVIALDMLAAGNKLALYTNTRTPNFATDPSSYSSTNEITGTGYTAGGQVIGAGTFSLSGDVLTYDIPDLVWAGSTLTNVRGCSAYADGLSPKASMWDFTFGADYSTVAGNLTIQWNALGVITWDLVP